MATWKQPAEYNRLHLVNSERLAQDIAKFEANWDEVQQRQAVAPLRWKKLAVWVGMVLFCALAWYGTIWLAYRATEGLR